MGTCALKGCCNKKFMKDNNYLKNTKGYCGEKCQELAKERQEEANDAQEDREFAKVEKKIYAKVENKLGAKEVGAKATKEDEEIAAELIALEKKAKKEEEKIDGAFKHGQ